MNLFKKYTSSANNVSPICSSKFNLWKTLLVSLTIAVLIITFVVSISATFPQALYPYTPYQATTSFSTFTNVIYLFLLILSILALLGTLIKKIKGRWMLIWFFTANFLSLGKETISKLNLTFPEEFSFNAVFLFSIALCMLCLYSIRRFMCAKQTLKLGNPFLKEFALYATGVAIVFGLIILVSFYGTQTIKYNLSQSSIIFLAMSLPFTAALFVQAMIQDQKWKYFFILASLSLLFLGLTTLLIVPIDSLYGIN